jgi:hypothetical protein
MTAGPARRLRVQMSDKARQVRRDHPIEIEPTVLGEKLPDGGETLEGQRRGGRWRLLESLFQRQLLFRDIVRIPVAIHRDIQRLRRVPVLVQDDGIERLIPWHQPSVSRSHRAETFEVCRIGVANIARIMEQHEECRVLIRLGHGAAAELASRLRHERFVPHRLERPVHQARMSDEFRLVRGDGPQADRGVFDHLMHQGGDIAHNPCVCEVSEQPLKIA